METILSSPIARVDLVFASSSSCSPPRSSPRTLRTSWASPSRSSALHAFDTAGAMPPNSNCTSHLHGLSIFIMVATGAVLILRWRHDRVLFAKSYKEAQSYVSPLMSSSSFLPSARCCQSTSRQTCLVPILNASLLCKELVTAPITEFHRHHLFLTCVYCRRGALSRVKMFQRELLFRS